MTEATEISTLRAELAETKAGYHALDKNWQHLHDSCMDAIRVALSLPEATVPEMVRAIEMLRLKSEWSGKVHTCITAHNATGSHCTVCGKNMTAHVFWDEDSIYVIAYSYIDAARVYDEYYAAEIGGEHDPIAWSLFPLDQEISICVWHEGPEAGEIAPAYIRDDRIETVRKSAAEWALRGRGFLASADG